MSRLRFYLLTIDVADGDYPWRLRRAIWLSNDDLYHSFQER